MVNLMDALRKSLDAHQEEAGGRSGAAAGGAEEARQGLGQQATTCTRVAQSMIAFGSRALPIHVLRPDG